MIFKVHPRNAKIIPFVGVYKRESFRDRFLHFLPTKSKSNISQVSNENTLIFLQLKNNFISTNSGRKKHPTD